ncbi:Soluble lytic murein transglycosylase [Sporobacter termitidis DSM 10068]|uniref:Soluble lytic murein transglycosylase n=1 Tax=Sporobacter termitidis DSM 10068 TaxID=1123282 RepID=A0A1M5XE12_9FIRM|nr:transglycosylase SLT domain-containing protein [Sporobacter termitidis]SHH97999.1 Soluble lytic murein transglycosylase [Sporobacter termitidis DSM 10068]
MYIFKKRQDSHDEPPADIGRHCSRSRIAILFVIMAAFIAVSSLPAIKTGETTYQTEQNERPDALKAETIVYAEPEPSLPPKTAYSCITIIDITRAEAMQFKAAQAAEAQFAAEQAEAAPAKTAADTTPVKAVKAEVAQTEEVQAEAVLADTAQAAAVPPADTAPDTTAPVDTAPAGTTQADTASPIYNPNVPLSAELQQYLYDLCAQRNLDYKMVLAIIRHESGFKAGALGGGNNYGLFQINICHHKSLSATLKTGNTPYDPKTNMNWGTYLLSCLYARYSNSYSGEDLTKAVLSSYNKGTGGFERYGYATKYIQAYYKALDVVNGWFAS